MTALLISHAGCCAIKGNPHVLLSVKVTARETDTGWALGLASAPFSRRCDHETTVRSPETPSCPPSVRPSQTNQSSHHYWHGAPANLISFSLYCSYYTMDDKGHFLVGFQPIGNGNCTTCSWCISIWSLMILQWVPKGFEIVFCPVETQPLNHLWPSHQLNSGAPFGPFKSAFIQKVVTEIKCKKRNYWNFLTFKNGAFSRRSSWCNLKLFLGSLNKIQSCICNCCIEVFCHSAELTLIPFDCLILNVIDPQWVGESMVSESPTPDCIVIIATLLWSWNEYQLSDLTAHVEK